MAQLILKRAPMGDNQDDYDVLESIAASQHTAFMGIFPIVRRARPVASNPVGDLFHASFE